MKFKTTDEMTRNKFTLRFQGTGDGEYRVIVSNAGELIDSMETDDWIAAYEAFTEFSIIYGLSGTPLGAYDVGRSTH